MKKTRLVMVGNGMAGVRVLEELLKLRPGHHDITVFGTEPHPNYNRVLLSPVLAGEQTLDEIVLNPYEWYEQNGIRLHAGRTAVEIDRARRVVRADDGTVAGYDRLLLATGSKPFVLPVPGHGLEGVIAYRDIADIRAMIEAARQYRKAVVIGGGVLGVEAANGLMLRGMEVTVVHANPWLMDRQLDETAARLLQRPLQARGIRFRLGAQTQEFVGGADGRVKRVKFADGSAIDADLVVMAVGIRPNVALAQQAGLEVDRGIVVDDAMRSVTDPDILAVGECASHRGVAYGLVAPLFEQAAAAASQLASGEGRYTGSVVSTKLKVTGIDLLSAGQFMGGAGTEDIVLSDPADGVYKKLVIKDDRLVGACLFGDTADGGWYLRLLREGRDVSAIRGQLMFGEV